jgi:hypothetical protein
VQVCKEQELAIVRERQQHGRWALVVIVMYTLLSK